MSWRAQRLWTGSLWTQKEGRRMLRRENVPRSVRSLPREAHGAVCTHAARTASSFEGEAVLRAETEPTDAARSAQHRGARVFVLRKAAMQKPEPGARRVRAPRGGALVSGSATRNPALGRVANPRPPVAAARRERWRRFGKGGRGEAAARGHDSGKEPAPLSPPRQLIQQLCSTSA